MSSNNGEKERLQEREWREPGASRVVGRQWRKHGPTTAPNHGHLAQLVQRACDGFFFLDVVCGVSGDFSSFPTLIIYSLSFKTAAIQRCQTCRRRRKSVQATTPVFLAALMRSAYPCHTGSTFSPLLSFASFSESFGGGGESLHVRAKQQYQRQYCAIVVERRVTRKQRPTNPASPPPCVLSFKKQSVILSRI